MVSKAWELSWGQIFYPLLGVLFTEKTRRKSWNLQVAPKSSQFTTRDDGGGLNDPF